MRKADLKKNHEPLDVALSRYRAFMEKAIAARRVIGGVQEKRDLAESVILRVCANWESFVDRHLADCINRDSSKLPEFFGVAIPKHPGADLCWALLFGERYRDFRSVDNLRRFSKKILPDVSNPFLAVTKAHAERIDEVYKIRNYLSHYSFKSRRVLRSMYTKRYKMKRFQEPGQFLLAYNARRLWGYFNAFQGASSDMKNWY